MAAPVEDTRIVTPTVPTLSHLALVKVALLLWNEFGMLLNEAFKHLREQEINLKNKNTQMTKLDEAIKKLHLVPYSLRRKIVEAIHGLEYEIDQWQEDHFDLGYENCIFIWRSDGSIDRIKSARQLVVNSNIAIDNRFCLACVYCLEESVRTLWDEMEVSGDFSLLEHYSRTMVPFWVGRMRESSPGPWIQAIVEYIYEHASTGIKKLACSSFFPLLQSEDRGKILSLFEKPMLNDLRFCLYAMTAEEQEKILRRFAVNVLKFYSEWPLRRLFFQTAGKLWNYLDEASFIELLRHVLIHLQPSEDLSEDFEYCKYVVQLWNISPDHFKERARETSFISDQIDLCLSEIRKEEKLMMEKFKKKLDSWQKGKKI